MTGKMQGKVALVTGAARGQGRSHAVRLAQEGADIIAVDICDQIATVPYAMAAKSDLDEAGVAALGRLDVVVANAGIIPIGPGVPPSGFLDAVSVDLVGVVNTIEAAFPHLGPGASIICTGSMAALMPGAVDGPNAGPGAAGYTHAKRAVARLVHDLALALARHSIRVNAVHPGNTDTAMLQNDAMYKTFRPDLDHPTRADAEGGFRGMHRLPVTTIDPVDISEAVLFLASDASRYVTGQQLKVDAGALLPVTKSGAPD
jgi:NAD(P)-dependent dehydrogenase (short-subunit alcohol dehydrogenase family)